MRVLVTGVKGQLGYDVMNELAGRGHEGIGVDIQEMDITDAASVEKVITEAAPDLNMDAVVLTSGCSDPLCSLYSSRCGRGQRGSVPPGQRRRYREYRQSLQSVKL